MRAPRKETSVGVIVPLAILAGLTVLGLSQERPAACLAFMAAVPLLSAAIAPLPAVGIVALATVPAVTVTAAATYGQSFSDAIPIVVGVIVAAGAAVLVRQMRQPTAVRQAIPPEQARTPAAEVDDLTGLPSRAGALRELAGRHHHDLRVVALIDVDALERINAAHGRGVGDVVLFAVGGRTRYALGDDDLVARWEDDEFLLVVPAESSDLLELVARKVNENPIRTDAGLVPATLCLGAAPWPVEGDFEDALRRAHRALASAKSRGPGQLVVEVDGAS